MSDLVGTWIDGARAQQLPADDRAVQYGDGLFETILVRAGRPRFLDAHLARLALGCERLAIPFTNIGALRDDIARACREAPALAVLKIIVTRGSARRRGYAPAGDETPRRLVSVFEAGGTPPEWRNGVRLVFATAPIGENPQLAGIKHLCRLVNVLASREARVEGAFDALLRTADGGIVSGAMTNVFALRAGRVLTPPVTRAGVAGVLRSIVLRECAALGIPASELMFDAQALLAADEVFVTNARIGVVPVRRLGEHDWTMESSSVARRLAAHVEALDA